MLRHRRYRFSRLPLPRRWLLRHRRFRPSKLPFPLRWLSRLRRFRFSRLLSPLRFVPVLVLQLSYKVIWFLAVFFPALVAGQVPTYGWGLAAIFATFVIGDLVAIPFPYLLERERERAVPAAGAGPV